MALYTRREFIEQLCGQEWNDANRAKISIWIKRGKVILNDGKIDDENPTNRDWALKQRDDANYLAEPEEAQVKFKDVDFDGGTSLDRQYKKKQIEKMTVDTRIAELKEEKIRGEVVPMDLVKNIFTTHTQSILTAQKDGIEQLLIDFTMEARLTGVQLAKLRGRMVEILNKGVDKAITITQRNMKTLVDEFSLKREVGEHD